MELACVILLASLEVEQCCSGEGFQALSSNFSKPVNPHYSISHTSFFLTNKMFNRLNNYLNSLIELRIYLEIYTTKIANC